MKGRIHSIESLATLDGPGLRTVVFLQGCPLRCKFCHNVDLAPREGGKEVSVDEVVERVMKNKEYWGKPGEEATGGVTFSGGEPTFQIEFLHELLKRLKQEGVHIAVDSCSFVAPQKIDLILPYVDLWMLSIKHISDQKHRELTGVPNRVIQSNIKYTDSQITEKNLSSRIRIRYVVIPDLTDNEEDIKKLGDFISEIKNIEKVELLAYTSMGKHKWIENFGEYPLEQVRDATRDDVKRVEKILEEFDLPVIY